MRKRLWIPLLVALETFVIGMADAQSQRLRQVEVSALLPHCITKDQMFRPTDPTCQPGTLCTSWQDIPESTIGPLEVGRHDSLWVDFGGNYNCDGCIDAVSFPYVQIRLQLSTDGGPFEEVTEHGRPRSSYVPNGGVDLVRRHVVPVAPGGHTLRMQHRFAINAANNPLLTRLCLTEGTMRAEILFQP
jgi:hypothetical protein